MSIDTQLEKDQLKDLEMREINGTKKLTSYVLCEQRKDQNAS